MVLKIKKVIYPLLICAVFLLSSCAGRYDSLPEDYHAETDYPYTFYTGVGGPCVAPAENGYYFLSEGYLYYMDQAQMEPVLLCSRPDCKHEQEAVPEQCNAYFDNPMLPYVQFYEGQLYVMQRLWNENSTSLLDSEQFLMRVSPDGTNREIAARVEFTKENEQSSAFFAMHRGYLYTAYGDTYGFHLKRASLSEGGEIYEELFSAADFGDFFYPLIYGKHLYLVYWTISESGERHDHVYDFDLTNGSHQEILTDDFSDGIRCEPIALTDQYFFFWKRFADERAEIWRYDRENGNAEQISSDFKETGAFFRAFYDGENLLLYRGNQSGVETLAPETVSIIDLEGNVLKEEIPLDTAPVYTFAGGDPGWSFAYSPVDHKLTAIDKRNEQLALIDISEKQE